MKLSEFEHFLYVNGTNANRWSKADRSKIEAMINSSQDARKIYAQISTLDKQMNTHTVKLPGEELRQRIVTAVTSQPQKRANVVTLFRTQRAEVRYGIVSAIAASLVYVFVSVSGLISPSVPTTQQTASVQKPVQTPQIIVPSDAAIEDMLYSLNEQEELEQQLLALM